ncbi:PKD domain-containing protein [Nocardioides sp. TF02-7]|nr:PKD domain-containing protein [Nocardioides sp. TF02-7]
MEFGPDGSLYVLDYGNGGYFTGNENSAVYKINYVEDGTRAPRAEASATPDSGQPPLEVEFSSEGSTDPDTGDEIVSYAWDFDGDGTTDSTAPDPTHTYAEEGQYDARLTVTDTTGRTGNATVVVTVGNTRPTVEIQTPPDGGFFEFGDTVHVTVNVTDPEEQEIDCTDVRVEYVLGHDTHGHPLSSATGCDVQLPTVADEGHDASANVFGVINVRYTDGGSGVAPLTGEDEVVLQPKRKQAEHFTSQQGVQLEAVNDPQGGASSVAFIDDGDHVSYAPVNLTGVEKLRFRVSSGGVGGTIEARFDSPTGELVGSVPVTPTGGWQNWGWVEMEVPEAARSAGTHELFLVFEAPSAGQTGLFNVNFFDAVGRGVSENSRPTVTASASPVRGEAPLEVAFTGTAEDADGDELTYAWDFGVAGTDDDTADTLEATYTYQQAGTYTARLTVTDARGASRTASVGVQVLPECPGEAEPSDEFDGETIDTCRWNMIFQEDPELYELADGQLTITTTPSEFYQDADPAAVRNVFLQSADHTSEDYVLETRITAAELTTGYSQAGLVVVGDPDNYVKLVVIADEGQGRINRVEVRSEVGSDIQDPQLDVEAPANVSAYRLRLTKVGTDYTGEVAFDGADWQTISTVSHPTAAMSFGLAAFGVNQPDRDVTFDYFRVTGEEEPEPEPEPKDRWKPKVKALAPKGRTADRTPKVVAKVSDRGRGVARKGDQGPGRRQATEDHLRRPARPGHRAGAQPAPARPAPGEGGRGRPRGQPHGEDLDVPRRPPPLAATAFPPPSAAAGMPGGAGALSL